MAGLFNEKFEKAHISLCNYGQLISMPGYHYVHRVGWGKYLPVS